MSSEGPLKVYMLNILFRGGWEGGVGGKVVAVHVLICSRNKKIQIQIQACKFLKIQRLETEIISLLFVSKSGTLIEKLGLISTLM